MTVESSPPSQFRIEVGHCCFFDQADHALVAASHQSGIVGVTSCRLTRLYFLRGTLNREEAEQLAGALLADPVTETYIVSSIEPEEEAPTPASTDDSFAAHYPLPTSLAEQMPDHTIDVTLLPGVTDPAAENLLRAAEEMGIAGLERAATGQRYAFQGNLSKRDMQRLAHEVCSNPVIQRYTIDQPISPPFVPVQQADTTVEIIPLRGADDATLRATSTERRLALDLSEMQAIRGYFQREGRDPTDAELETLAQTWSEHCVHKTFRAVIEFTSSATGENEPGSGQPVTPRTIDGLLRTYIRGATEQLAKPWLRSAFVDNAGVIAFDDEWDLAFKVETHNHPSALEPFGGANTGVGGVVRDILGVSARPIANTDVLCFGPPDLPDAELPEGVLHPRRVAEGVIHGVEDYGNKMGIPTVNGAVLYHPGYTANPLVFCGCVGLLPRGSHPTRPQPGDYIVAVGGRTGRDGLRGATFSSMEMDQTTSQAAGSAVQIGHPIHEKQVLEAVLRARDEQLYHAITDCGAGGFASAVGEMGRHLGAHVQLEHVPLKYPGLRPWEIWLSEAQERMVLAVAPDHWPRLKEICDGQDIEAVSIGTFETSGRLRLSYDDIMVGDLAMDFLHDGIPRRHLAAEWNAPQSGHAAQPDNTPPPAARSDTRDLTPALLALLAHPNIRSKEPVVRRYDHEVQGGTAIKPLVGVDDHGPSDAAVIVPLDTLLAQQPAPPPPRRGAALAAGICPAYGLLDPYAMAWAAVDEAIRNAVAVGGDPDRVALLDNFCWGNPNLPDRLGSLVRCAQGCHDAAVAYSAPFISGKDSLNNEYTGADGRKHAIPGTLLISSVAIVPDAERAVTMDLKGAGNLLYLVGETRAELGGSHHTMITNDPAVGSLAANTVPQPVANSLERLRAVHRAIGEGVVLACHDCSEGGLGVALAEMCIAGRLGAEVDLSMLPALAPPDSATHQSSVLLFSESLCRFIVEVHPDNSTAFETLFESLPLARLGTVCEAAQGLRIAGPSGGEVVRAEVAQLETAWRGESAPPTPAPAPTSSPSPDYTAPTPHTAAPRVLVLHATGTNRDRDAVLACRLAGAAPEVVHINQLLAGERCLLDYHMLVVPGGFSYGDDLGAGTLWALDLRHRLDQAITAFVASGRPVLGICNGFQALVKAGLLPGSNAQQEQQRRVTLAPNTSGHFECRWVYLKPQPSSPCLFTRGLEELMTCPVAHGEGRFVARNDEALDYLHEHNLVALTYVDSSGAPANYPANPNGSIESIAGLCNRAGNVLGMMPHPEDHIFPWQHPRWQRGKQSSSAGILGMSGLRLFENGVKAC